MRRLQLTATALALIVVASTAAADPTAVEHPIDTTAMQATKSEATAVKFADKPPSKPVRAHGDEKQQGERRGRGPRGGDQEGEGQTERHGRGPRGGDQEGEGQTERRGRGPRGGDQEDAAHGDEKQQGERRGRGPRGGDQEGEGQTERRGRGHRGGADRDEELHHRPAHPMAFGAICGCVGALVGVLLVSIIRRHKKQRAYESVAPKDVCGHYSVDV